MASENRFLAKSKPLETIEQHTQNLVHEYRLLKQLYPHLPINWDILLLAVLFHDLGKANSKFQNKLYKQLQYPLLKDDFPNEEEIPHGNLSPAFLDREKLLENFSLQDLKILYQAIYYHHPRAIAKNRIQYLISIIKQDLSRYVDTLNFSHPYFNKAPKMDYNKLIRERIDYTEEEDPDIFYPYVLTRGLLNRLDYAASAHIKVEVPNLDLEEKALNFLKGLGGLREIQQYMLDHQEENNILVASTGIGKTEAGLLWINNNKGFFTLPLRVSINAIYQRIKHGKIGFKDTALLHSDALAFLISKEESIDYLEEYTKARLFSMPLTITTVDQLFKFVFKQEGFESILATLGCAKIIIDEIQMYSPEIVACILMGLKYISGIGGKFSILTATYPAILDYFLKRLGIRYHYKEFILNKKRHRIKLLDQDINDALEEIIEKGKESKVLVIVNTVKKAQELYRELGNIDHKYLLHSRFIKHDRARLEDEIMDFSEKGQKGIWVTTQVVEASLDIDFDFLFTELSTVDGLFQRMGRCFRKRELLTDITNVFVFTKNASGVGNFIDREIFELSKQALHNFNNILMSEQDKLAVVRDVYSEEKIRPTEYFKAINSRLHLLEDIRAYEFERQEVEEKFRNIKSHTVVPASIYNENQETIQAILEELKELGFTGEEKIKRIQLLDRVKKLTVDVPHYFVKHIGEEISMDRKNRIKIINLEYDRGLGLLSGVRNEE